MRNDVTTCTLRTKELVIQLDRTTTDRNSNASEIMPSPFLNIAPNDWIASNELAFAVFDGFPVTPGHALVVTRRLCPTWFDATQEEQAALMQLVNDVKARLDETLSPTPDGYNVGFNCGEAAGQTVPHVHIHVIPRYTGDVPDPRGGVRYVIPDKANYLQPPPSPFPKQLTLTTGAPATPLWNQLAHRIQGANAVDLVVSFVRPSGLEVIKRPLMNALKSGTQFRILVSDYLGISSPEALDRLLGWIQLIDTNDDTDNPDDSTPQLQGRLLLTETLPGSPASFHPKAWQILTSEGSSLVVGSSNLSRPALQTGVEWNLIVDSAANTDPIQQQAASAFQSLWDHATPLSAEVIGEYRRRAQSRPPQHHLDPDEEDQPLPRTPLPWQRDALASLQSIRNQGLERAIVAVATGMGKTWLAAFDIAQLGTTLQRRPRVLIIAHQKQILIQAETTIAGLLDQQFSSTTTTWYAASQSSLDGQLVVASIQKLARPDGLRRLQHEHFDYVLIDEVHHAQAPSYRRVLNTLNATFTLGLTATPERADGTDVVALFDDHLAYQATIGEGIESEVLVPFQYIGLRDTVDFEQIPWRSGRFDVEELERRVLDSDRMQRLWTTLLQHPAQRTIVFCCSQRHALFTRDWLREHGATAAAVISGSGGDDQSRSLTQLHDGSLQFLCAVDMFNEGLDVPAVDRVILLRPTDSQVVFLQQLGRGLRSSEGKRRLLVIDFVGNHRVFTRRLIHLLSLNGTVATNADLRRWLEDDTAPLPEGCLIDVELEAKDLLRQFLPRGKVAAEEGYRALREDLGRRPTMRELESHGYLPRTIAAGYDGWFRFVEQEDDLTTSEATAVQAHRDWLQNLETTSLTLSAKMLTVRVLLDAGLLFDGMPLEQLCLATRRYARQHQLLRQDYLDGAVHVDESSDEDWIRWWTEWPVDRWLNPTKGPKWFRIADGKFCLTIKVDRKLQDTLQDLSSEIVDWRLQRYVKKFENSPTSSGPSTFTAKVSHNQRGPILFLPTVEQRPGRPVGPTPMRLPDGTIWTFRCVKVACNVAMPAGTKTNELPTLLRDWFGPDAGLPGTNFQVEFAVANNQWSLRPLIDAPPATAAIETPPEQEQDSLEIVPDVPTGERFTRYAPVYNLSAAAGGWGPEGTPEISGWVLVPNTKLNPHMFVAQVHGQSMEPLVPSGAWCLFRPCPAGSRQGRRLLVQLSTAASHDDGGRYTLKLYHSTKSLSPDGWEHQSITLKPLNPDFPDLTISPEHAHDLRIVGEFVALL